MPAAAVIPAPLAYIKVVAVKKLVVEFWTGSCGTGSFRSAVGLRASLTDPSSNSESVVSSLNRVRSGLVQPGSSDPLQQHVYLEKIRVLRAGSWDVKVSLCLNNVAWNNRIRPRFYSVGLIEQQTSWFRHQTASRRRGLRSALVVWGLKISVP